MAISFTYWDECVDPKDMEEMWKQPEVRSEWIAAGESKGQRVHLSRDPDGQPYLTQTEIRAVAEIIIGRHFPSLDPDMICAIAELESDRQPLAMRYDKKSNLTTIGLMQIAPKTAEWMVRLRDSVHSSYKKVEEDPDILYSPFVGVYFGAAYLNWLSNVDKIARTEEFIVRAYKGGTKKASHKSTLQYWKRYLSVKESFPPRKHIAGPSRTREPHSPTSPNSPASPCSCSGQYWDSKVSPEDMEELWHNPSVFKEWTKSKEKRGEVRFSLDKDNKPYLSQVELKAVAEIIVSKYFSTRRIKPVVLCAVAEMISKRFIHGTESRPGIMGINYSTAFWLYSELGYRAYRVNYAKDMTKPFESMYFGAAYLAWLSEYKGRERSPQFVVQAYILGPKNVKEVKGPLWLKFVETLSSYEPKKRKDDNCTIL